MRTFKLLAAVLFVAVIPLLFLACASVDDVLVNKEAGFYYGSAVGATEAAAIDSAFDDFIYNVLSESGSIKADKKAKVAITPEMRQAFTLLKLKPFNVEKQKKENKVAVVFRIASKDWIKAEQKRLDGLAAELGGRFTTVKADNAKPAFDRLKEAAGILVAINRNGVTLKLNDAAGSTSALYPQVENFIKDLVAGTTWTLFPDSGLLKTDSKLALTVVDRSGKALAGVPLVATWSAGGKSVAPTQVKTDAKGRVELSLAADQALRNQKLVLKLQTAFSLANPEAALLPTLDAGFVKEYNFRHADANLSQAAADEVKVPGGTFMVGKVAHDTTFGVAAKEKAREVKVATFYIDRNLVTNAQYKTFLESTGVSKANYPDYMDNEEFNDPQQPVIGITVDEARKYAAWISGVLGVTKRLPTEDEYEIAAHGGQVTIYPWGDQKPSDGVRANYDGNGRFAGTSPVGSFENGRNPLGLNDMVGNVWQWTSSTSDDKAVVKGGSYMDSPTDLRISNRRFEDPKNGYADIGFRLVREAANE